MKAVISTVLLSISFCICSWGQFNHTLMKVYDVLQQKCASCHSHAEPTAGLDLEGDPQSTFAERAAEVYDNLYLVNPNNADANAAGYKYIVPGRVDQSFLFRKINNGFEPFFGLDEGGNMPPAGNEPLTDREKELLRQWILFGAPDLGQVVDENLIDEYYSGNGQASFPDGAPEAPAAEEGFQIKMGPFYLEPGGEVEYFQKYQLDLPENVEVTRIEIFMSSYSHHFILYDFPSTVPNYIPEGLRLNADHTDISLVAAVQEPTDLRLPNNTAFKWDNDHVLDLNSHYINYSATSTYQAEAYINVYTQEAGTAAQEMYTELIVNNDIYIPNNGNVVTHEQQVIGNAGEVFVWGLMGHTHQYGTAYKAYKRLPGGVKGDIIYDAACPQGIPGCVSPYFDYQHIPMRYFDPIFPMVFNSLNGLIHEASWINDGPEPVWFGPTSDDEMMVLVLMYLLDTTGVITDIREIQSPLDAVEVYPNPADKLVTFSVPVNVGMVNFRLYDALGQVIMNREGINELFFDVERENLPPGMYFYRIEDQSGAFKSGKLYFR